MLIALAAHAAEPCATGASTIVLAEAVEAANRSLVNLEPEAFVQATDRLDALLPCLAEPLSRHLAAEIHRTKGIRAASEQRPDASRYFAAARAIEPAYKLPNTLIPEGHPVRTEYAAFDLTTGTFDPIPAPGEGTLTLDANARLYRPTSWPTIAQFLGPDGGVRFTRYLGPQDPLPDYPVVGELVSTPLPAPLPLPAPTLPPPRPGSAKVPFGAAAIGGAVLTGALVGLAAASEARFKDLETPDADLLALRSRANSLVVASSFTGAASLGLGVAFLVVK